MKLETIRACSIWRALEVVGDVPVLLILEQAFLGRNRFDDFVAETGISRSIVANRLNKLGEEGVLHKSPGRRGGYALTAKGHGLYPIGLMMLRWQQTWESAGRDYAMQLVHDACGANLQPVPCCAHCHGEIDPREVDWREGPGLSQVTPVYARRRVQTGSLIAKRGTLTLDNGAIELFGDRWATLVVRACFTGFNRFDEIQRDTQMASNVLSGRLDRLIGQGILQTRPIAGGNDRSEYRLTAKGRDLYPVLLALLQWGDRWYADDKGPPLLLTHRTCGHALKMEPVCSHCQGSLAETEIRASA